MGGLVGGIFDLTQGDPTSTEQSELGSLGTQETSTGTAATNAAQGYYGGILSGNQAQIAETLAPEISSGAQAEQQQKQTNAEFGNRSGGTNSSTQAADSQERGNIINLIGQAQQGAASGEASLGTNLLGQASSNINSQAGLATQNQQRETSDVGGIASGVASIAAGLPAFGSTAPDPYESLYNAQNAQTSVGSELNPTTSSSDDFI